MKTDPRTTTPTSTTNQPRLPSPSPTPTSTSTEDGARSGTPKSEVPCKFFGKTNKGCIRTSKCPFKHSWDGLDKKDRCMNCGGKGHPSKECPVKKPQVPQGNKDGRDKPSSSTTTPSTRTVKIDEKPEVNPIPARQSEENPSASDIKDVLADVGKMLKATQATSLKALKVQASDYPEDLPDVGESLKKVDVNHGSREDEGRGGNGILEDSPAGLLDSGASHPMRPATETEYVSGTPVSVTLAGEDVKVLRQNDQGTILVKEDQGPIQSIVPLGALIQELGYTLHWGPNHLRLTHPVRGPIRVRIHNNCPEVAACDALAMIRELEMTQVRALNNQVETLKARLEVIKKQEERDWWEILRDYMSCGKRSLLLKALLKCPFTKALPYEVQSLMLEDFDMDSGLEYLKCLPITRRMRKALMNSPNWVVTFYLGDTEQNHPLKMVTQGGKILLEIDMKYSKQWDIHATAGVYRLLLWGAVRGKITDIISSLPERTWPTSQTPRRGVDSYHLRTKASPFGREDLLPHQRQQIWTETASALKPMLLWMIATMANKGLVGFLMEMHADPEWLHQGDSPFATFWKSEEWKAFKSVSGMKQASFYMGGMGHATKRPTTVGTNYPSIAALDGNYDFHEGVVPPSLLTRSAMRTWSLGFKQMVLEAVTGADPNPHCGDDLDRSLDPKVNKMTQDQRNAWRQHLINDHQPYRKDCSVCINAQASGYRHQRQKHPHLFTLALDLAGPFKTRGRDMEFDDYKYVMVAAYRCPKEYMSAMAIPEVDRELYVPDQEEEPPGDDDPFQIDEEEMKLVQKEPSLEDEEATEDEAEKKLDEDIEKLTHPPETATIYLTKPLRRRTTAAVLEASKELVLQLRQSGLYVGAIHTDRAREFSSKSYKTWIVGSELRHTKTAGGDPAGNSTAELGVKWAKARMRSLIKSAKADPKDWPMAIHHATSSLWSKAFPMSPWTNHPAATFGSEVWFRAKAYKGTKEKKWDAGGVRWKRGWYRGPSTEVSRGHLILREDGGLTIAKSVKFNVINPEDLGDLLPTATADGVPEAEPDSQPPKRKELAAEIEFVAKRLLEEKNFELDEVLGLYNRLEELGDSDMRIGKKSAVTAWYTGAFVHGGCAGLRKNLYDYPNTTEYLVAVSKKYAPGANFSALGIARNATLGLHRDSHNHKHSFNVAIPITSFQGGSLWAYGREVSEEECVLKETPGGKLLRGRLHHMQKGVPVKFIPTAWHEVQEWEGDRVVLLLYTPRASKLAENHIDLLESKGFPLDRGSFANDGETDDDDGELGLPFQEEIAVKAVRIDSAPEVQAFIELGDEDLFDQERPATSETPNVKPNDVNLKKILKKAEVQYTPNIESILKDHVQRNTPLEVTHTVSPQDVKRNIEEWRSSAVKEFVNLKDNKQAFVVKKKHQLPPGCRIVPCKGVYTVKPDKSTLFRRKTRFVACGNHVPEGQEGMDLFAAGLDATTLRTMLSYTIGKPWKYGTTDIRQAFVLAPWLGLPVALQPPAIAYELGLAEPGDYWLVTMSIYGLRESPALWSKFRDEQLTAARWCAEVDGKEEELKLIQMVTDDQVWKIVRTRGSQEPLGYLMVYIDDLLINALPNVMNTFFEWIAARWECDSLDVLEPKHPIRFLGMEFHMVDEGVELSQEGFVRELLRSHGHDGARSKSQAPKDSMLLTLEEEEAMITAAPVDLTGKESEIKAAQRVVGELLWLTGRTRPDLQYLTALLSSRITRCPEIVNGVAQRVLNYLNETIHYRLRFSPTDDPVDALHVFTDSSFAPSSGRSHGAAAVFFNDNPIVWRSSRQALVSLSTAESELLEAVDGAILGCSTRALLEELRGKPLFLYLHVDNQSAVMLLQGSSGSWRTRHLRLRANFVKEKMTQKELVVVYEPGVCGVTAQQERLQAEIPWDLYVVVIALAIVVIFLWEMSKTCVRGGDVRLRALRARAGYGRMSRNELKELQRLLALEPRDLTDAQGARLLYLKDMFETTMPANTSPVPTLPPEMSSRSLYNRTPALPDAVIGDAAAAARRLLASAEEPGAPAEHCAALHISASKMTRALYVHLASPLMAAGRHRRLPHKHLADLEGQLLETAACTARAAVGRGYPADLTPAGAGAFAALQVAANSLLKAIFAAVPSEGVRLPAWTERPHLLADALRPMLEAVYAAPNGTAAVQAAGDVTRLWEVLSQGGSRSTAASAGRSGHTTFQARVQRATMGFALPLIAHALSCERQFAGVEAAARRVGGARDEEAAKWKEAVSILQEGQSSLLNSVKGAENLLQGLYATLREPLRSMFKLCLFAWTGR
eukprot:s3792_g6.t1